MIYSILLTGATGFIGQHLLKAFTSRGIACRCAVRQHASQVPNSVVVGEIDDKTYWSEALQGVDSVIHLAGRAHVLHDRSDDPLQEHRRVNTHGTIRLAQEMAARGCRRLVFVSTIGVHGDSTHLNQAVSESSPATPTTPYTIAKWEAEQQLASLYDSLEIVVVRPPLVYGVNAPGNFGRLVRLVDSGVPLPFGAVNNLRSLVSVQNLCDFLITCASRPKAAGETFVISDGEDLSTAQLLKLIAAARKRSARLVPVPAKLLRIFFQVTGRERLATQLLGSLVVNSDKARRLLNWKPPMTVAESMSDLQEKPS